MAERTITVGRDVLSSVLVTGGQMQVTVGGPGLAPPEPPAFRILTLIARPLEAARVALPEVHRSALARVPLPYASYQYEGAI